MRVPTSTNNVSSSIVSAHSATAALSVHNLFLTHVPFPISTESLNDGPKHHWETSEGRDAGISLLHGYGIRKVVPGMLY
jgi:hypothetical protein